MIARKAQGAAPHAAPSSPERGARDVRFWHLADMGDTGTGQYP